MTVLPQLSTEEQSIGSTCCEILRDVCRTPVLVDVGSTGGAPHIWRGIAPVSLYLGFDPDPRATAGAPQPFKRAIIVDKAVTAGDETTSSLYLTSAAMCSSVLQPDTAALADFLFAPLFDVERTLDVSTTTLDAELGRLGLSHIDWLKVDTQGTDRRVFNSVNPGIRSRILAVDVEPGLIDAYCGEDLFLDTHRDLTGQGFWLSRLSVGESVRIGRGTLETVSQRYSDLRTLLDGGASGAPAWVEARYLRTIKSLVQADARPEDFAVLWTFAALDGQFGFALDIAVALRRFAAAAALSATLEAAAVEFIRGRHRARRGGIVSRVLRRMAHASL